MSLSWQQQLVIEHALEWWENLSLAEKEMVIVTYYLRQGRKKDEN